VDPSGIAALNYPSMKAYEEPKNFKATKDSELIRQFKRTASDIFSMKLSPFHTGSLSVEDGNEMLYSSSLSSSSDFENEIVRDKIEKEEDDFFKNLHRAVYTHSSAKSAIFTHSPFAMIQSFCVLSKGMDRVIPVDAEGGYLYPAVPVVMPDTDMKSIIRKAEKYKMVVLAGLGVLAIGHTPGHTIHHVSSLKNICYLKTQLELMERVGVVEDADAYLDERGKNW
jgi:ribulose-5-phosphate 4-epimerase/fuculose-1-phosphate aldolase